ncbi:hypothetical protein V6Z11_A09G124800 [Gossypium hirsutum]
MVAGMSLLVRQFNLSVNLNNNDHNLLIRELDETKLKLSRLESVLEETIQSIDAKTLLLKEREKLFEDMENKITYLQSVISTLKDDSLLADESLRLYKRRPRSPRYVCFGMLRERTTLNFMFWNRKHRTLKIGWKLLI